MIIKCVKIGISKDAIMQFFNKALEIGLLDKERFANIKEIITALLDKRNQGWQVFEEIKASGKPEHHILPEQLRLRGEFLLYCILNSNIPQFRLVVWWCGRDFIPLQCDWKSEMTEFLITQIHYYKPKSTSNERTDLRRHSRIGTGAWHQGHKAAHWTLGFWPIRQEEKNDTRQALHNLPAIS